MLTPTLKTTAKAFQVSRRNLGMFAPALQKVKDPIQQLFLDKIRDFKAKSAGDKLVEPSPEMEAELKANIEKVFKQYNVKPADYNKFPSFAFKDPELQKPGIPVD